MFSKNKTGEFLTNFLLIGILGSLFFILAYLYLGEIKAHFDETDILNPIFYPSISNRKYGDFPYFFYSMALNLGRLFISPDSEIPFLRVTNCFLYPLNSILFYIFLKNYFSKWWAILGMILFALTPGVFFSAVEIKTESLLLFEFLILALTLEKLLNSPKKNQFFYVGLSGVISSLGLSTKFLPLFPILFLSSIYYLSENSKTKLLSKNNLGIICIYFIFFFLGLFLFFPNILVQWQKISGGGFSKDLFFNPGPNWFKAVNEFFSFPFGRYSYPLLTIIPITLGFFNYIGALLALTWRKVPKKTLLIYLPFLVIFFLYQCQLTLMQYPNFFTPISPIIILFSIYFWKELFSVFKKQKNTLFNILILIPLLSYSLFDYRAYSDYIYSYMNFFLNIDPKVRKTFSLPGKEDDLLLIFFNAGKWSEFNRSWDNIIQEKKPKYIFLFGAFKENYCKYRFDETYKKLCNYFNYLLSGKEGYSIIWKMPIEFSSRPWIFDPELNSNFYYLEKY